MRNRCKHSSASDTDNFQPGLGKNVFDLIATPYIHTCDTPTVKTVAPSSSKHPWIRLRELRNNWLRELKARLRGAHNFSMNDIT